MSGSFTNGMTLLTYLQGTEQVPCDTEYPQGINPASAAIPVGLLAAGLAPVANFRNVIDCGDATTNPWQRGNTFTGITSTLTYTADRFFAVGGASSSISVSNASLTAGALATFGNAFQFGRASSNTNTAQINFGQVIESGDSIRLQGQTVTLSFWALGGANFSPAQNKLNVVLASSTGTNQSAANLIAGSWTSYSALTPTTTTVQTYGGPVTQGTSGQGYATIVTGVWTRYTFTYVIPVTATQLGFYVSYVPVGTAGANDWVQFAGFQLESGAFASPYEHKDIQVELEIAQRYFWAMNEPAAGVVVGSGMNTTSSAQIFYIALPVQMRTAPTVTVSAGTFKTNQANVATATTITAGSTHTVNAISVNGSSTGTAGQATLLIGGGGAGYVYASADF